MISVTLMVAGFAVLRLSSWTLKKMRMGQFGGLADAVLVNNKFDRAWQRVPR